MSNNKQSEIPEDTENSPDRDTAESVSAISPGTSDVESDTPNTNQRVEVTADNLPLHCPLPGKRLWDSHPRVFLPVEDSGEEICPYCGTVYVLKGTVKTSH
jgi:uncharacterized Zn-finger protein